MIKEIDEITQLGFVEPEIEEENWKLGAVGDFPYVVYQPNGDWTKYLPDEEKQKIGFETSNCTAFGTTSVIETLLNRMKGEQLNLSDRYVGIMAGTSTSGNDPHKVAEAIRKERVCNEEDLPYKNVDNADEYYSFKGADRDEVIAKAHSFPYELKHTYLWTNKDNISQEEKLKRIREGLKHSPVGVSVTAWKKEGGLYIDGGKANTHWTMIYNADDLRKVFDSYSPYKKVLHPDHQIRYAKIYALVETPSDRPRLFTLKSLWEQVLNIYQIIAQKKTMNKQGQLLELAKSKIGTDFTPDYPTPDSVSCALAVTTLLNQIDSGIPIMAWTPDFDKFMANSPKFRRVKEPVGDIKPGSIVISPTGFGNGTIVGHTGIYLDKNRIMSNSSTTGLWETNFTRASWRKRYGEKGGLPIRIYELV